MYVAVFQPTGGCSQAHGYRRDRIPVLGDVIVSPVDWTDKLDRTHAELDTSQAASTDGAQAPCLIITDDDIHLFAQGSWNRSWEKMGAHPDTQNGVDGWRFCVWAPEVAGVSVVGDFNDWDVEANKLDELPTGGLWQGFVPGLSQGDLYKYVIETDDGKLLYKADPYGFWSEKIPGTASRLMDIEGYEWGDKAWMDARHASDHMKKPLNIYEVHLGSWRRHGDEPQGEPDENGNYPGPMDPFPAQRGEYYTYDDLSVELVDYVREMGYTHIEVLPVMEHPFDGSWGYQGTGYYAVTARYGEPKQFMHFIDACHQAGIGVILDWVPGGFCADAQGLSTFNGHMLYEREIHPNWGTHKFDFGRGEVRSFLISNVLFWIEQFHADGIRMDGVSSMLYLNFGVDDPAQKKFNKYGDEGDLDAIDFIRKVNNTVGQTFPDVMMMAEESTAWPLVTYPAEDGGLAFHYKWDMGWMNDTLHYMQTDFPWRPGNHTLLTFSIMYAFSENFILPLSHDEVVHGKCSLIGRMPGDWWRQFAGLRTLAFYQMTHPGAKLNFMGNEIAQFIEWRYYESIQWFLTEEYETHAKHQQFIKALNHLYTAEPALYELAYSQDGFEWIDPNDNEQSIISFVRHGENPDDDLVVLINFDPAFYETFQMGVPREGDYLEIFNSDDVRFGGSGKHNEKKLSSHPEPKHGFENSIELLVPPLAGIVLKRQGPSSYKPPKIKKTTARKTTAKKATATTAKKTATKRTSAKKTEDGAASSASKTTKTASAKKATATSKSTGTKKTKAASTTSTSTAKTVKTPKKASGAASTAARTRKASPKSSPASAKEND
ncbi:1,4-alpha-glucan branching protein GlgB [Collinsella tanakaei]|nr:1,4-alpha-glucan branching protein GlgB [Collinsella tanakaei]